MIYCYRYRTSTWLAHEQGKDAEQPWRWQETIAIDQEGVEMKTSVRKPVRTLTVLLVPKAARHLDRTRSRAQLSDTDIVNRAISLYDFIDGQLASGAQLVLRRPGRLTKKIRLR